MLCFLVALLFGQQEFKDAINALGSNVTPLDFFRRIVGPDFFDVLATETNNYMAGPYNRTHANFIPREHLTTAREMQAWTGGLFALHMTARQEVDQAWSKDFGIPILIEHFSRDRFVKLLRLFHFVNNDELPLGPEYFGYEPLQKVRPLIERIVSNTRALYVANCHKSSDEAIIPSKVRVFLACFFPLDAL